MIICAASAYLRAKEDYLMGINFSRLLTLKYGNSISSYPEYKIFRDNGRACHDVRPRNGRAQRAGDP